jgi:AraC-like DNA-binding protein
MAATGAAGGEKPLRAAFFSPECWQKPAFRAFAPNASLTKTGCLLKTIMPWKACLQKENRTVSEVAYAVGFTDPKYFSRVFSNEFGLPPSKI